MRSKQTGHVGSSISAGVGGGTGLELREADESGWTIVLVAVDVSDRGSEGVNGS